MRLCSKGTAPKKPHKMSKQHKAYTPEEISEAKRRITARRRAIEDKQIDREVEERLK